MRLSFKLSRTALCLLTALLLSVLSLGVMAFRHRVLGNEIGAPAGPGTWKVSLTIKGRGQGDARLTTATPLDFNHQRILRESCTSNQLLEHLPDARHPDRHVDRRTIHWTQRAGIPAGEFRASYEFYCATDVVHPTADMVRLTRLLQAPPQPGEFLDVDTQIAAENERLSEVARRETAGLERPEEQAQALFRFVERLASAPAVPGAGKTAAACLADEAGDARAKSRLLVALLHKQNIPARMVTGLRLVRGEGQLAHYWVRAWLQDQWLSLCPFTHHYGRVPQTFLIFGLGDLAIVRYRQASNVEYAFAVEKSGADEALAADGSSPLRRLLRSLSLYRLQPAEQNLVEFLLLMPIAALIICIFRNLVGVSTFGTFAPALVGLAFREIHSLPGIGIFVSIILVGWLMRRVLDHYHLLQTPRIALMLSLVVALLTGVVVCANVRNLEATRYISLFPMIILTGMIERFWTLETEDGTTSSFRTLVITILISGVIALTVGLRVVVEQMFCYPETLGLVMAAQLLIGRYTGYRLSELFRFRDFLRPEAGLRLYEPAEG